MQRPPARRRRSRSSAACGRPAASRWSSPRWPGRAADAPHRRCSTATCWRWRSRSSIRANPLDGVVLLSGCDKTTPGLLMGAASVDLPALMVTGGPMLNGKFRGQDIGSGTHVWRFTEEMRAGRMTAEDCSVAEGCMSRTDGHCMTMGTASTMACMAEALGMQLPGSAAVPAVDSRRYALAQAAGRGSSRMVGRGPAALAILTRRGVRERHPRQRGHRRLHQRGRPPARDRRTRSASRCRSRTSTSWRRRADAGQPACRPGKYLMEDFGYAGGLPAVMARTRRALLHARPRHRHRHERRRERRRRRCWNRDVIASLDAPFQPAGTGTAVLRGNLGPSGAVIKQSAASTAPAHATAARRWSSTRPRSTTRSPTTRISTSRPTR